MQINTRDLTGAALDWAVGIVFNPGHEWGAWTPSTNWAQGGPIIERECIELVPTNGAGWFAQCRYDFVNDRESPKKSGPTPLIAAMRCYVASKLGDTVEVPDTFA